MSHLAPPSVRLLVCGNADRGDDGAALSAVATLLPTLPTSLLERLEVRRCGHLVGHRAHRHGQGAAVVVGGSAQVLEHGQARAPERQVGEACSGLGQHGGPLPRIVWWALDVRSHRRGPTITWFWGAKSCRSAR